MGDTVDDLDAIIADARALVAQKAWGPAGIAWARVAAVAMEGERREAARAAWDAAGEAWRRDDRLESSARALKMALGLAETERGAALAQVKLAGVLGEVGRLVDAERLCARAAAGRAPEDPLRAVLVDTWLNAKLALGQVAEARSLAEELDELPGPAQLAARFRRAQLQRLDGQLEGAEEQLSALMADLTGDERLRPALAAAQAELGEVLLLRGDYARAVAALELAHQNQEESGRRSLTLRAEAARVRVHVERGLPALVGEVDAGIDYAAERGLLVLECDLRLARGMALAERAHSKARGDLERAIQLADAAGSAHRSGRARYEWISRIDAPIKRKLSVLGRAEGELASSRPWVARCVALRARLMGDEQPEVALGHARAAHADFQAMKMDADRDAVASLVQQLSSRNRP